MLKYSLPALSVRTTQELARYQTTIDGEPDREQSYKTATKFFKSKTPRKAFLEIKTVLDAASPPGRACYYCKRDRYRDIEHIWPKRHYPEKAYVWENYVYSCTICNQDAKNDKFAVFDQNDNVIAFDRSIGFVAQIPIGDPVLINLRSENPLEYLMLDLETGLFNAIGNNIRHIKRGEYTRDLFNLDADPLSRIRRQAVSAFADYITRFVEALYDGDDIKSERIYEEIFELPFPTVLVEMRRQAPNYPFLNSLFLELPPEIGCPP